MLRDRRYRMPQLRESIIDAVKLSTAAPATIHSVSTRFVSSSGSAVAVTAIVSHPFSASRPIGIAASTSNFALASTTHCGIATDELGDHHAVEALIMIERDPYRWSIVANAMERR